MIQSRTGRSCIRVVIGGLCSAFLLTGDVYGQEKILNLYTARHYQTDEAFYAGFTKATGIRIDRIEGGEDALFERIKAEGRNSPADVFLTVDVARLWRADQAGIFAPVVSAALVQRIPSHYRDPDNKWFGFSARARVLGYDKNRIKGGELARYEDLADPKWKREICTRSSSHPYNLSLISSMVLHLGEEKATQWARGVAGNLARSPRGGDTDQLLAVGAGECAVAISNHYYYVRLMRSKKAEDQTVVKKVGLVWPNQMDRGTHVNISGGGMLRHAPHPEAAVRFLEYLASDEAQTLFAKGNNEWPTVKGVKLANPALESLGHFKADSLPLANLGKTQATAQRIADKVGWK
ncbi:MAG TPA: Fe(3+) ABC transporter substrate-binding protein [candidate division Zixibacteria bacterium]|nr:Fe(3+) ABC transporter substrate-binding protein [candidate division Zixibacteria bacterium]